MSEGQDQGGGGGDQAAAAAAATAAAAAAAAGQGGGQQQEGGQGGGGQQQAAADPWWGKSDLGLDQETANFYASRNAPSLAEALKSGMHAFKTATDRNVLPKPDPEKLGEWGGWKDLGWPEQRTDYKVESPKAKAPQGYPYNDSLETAFLDAMHEARIPPAQAQLALHKGMAHAFGEFTSLETAYDQDLQKTESELRAEWGGQYDAKKALGERAFRHYAPEGMDMAMLEEIMGAASVVKMFARIGADLGEERLVQPGGGQFGARSETTIRAELAQIEGDKATVNALMDPRHPRHGELNDKRNRLLEELAKLKTPR